MNEFQLFLPETLLVFVLLGLIIDEVGYHGERVRVLVPTALAGYAAAFIQTLLLSASAPARLFAGAIALDPLASFFKLFAILLGALVTVLAWRSREVARARFAEFGALVAAGAFFLCVVAGANDLMVGFLALQGVNVVSFFLAGFGKSSLLSVEAGVKQLVSSAVASLFFLFSIVLLFASTRSLNLGEIHGILVSHPLPHDTGVVVFVLFLMGLVFQLGAFPMQLWSPDVVEGAPTPSSAMIALASRAAGLALGVRVLVSVFAQPQLVPGLWQVMGSVDWTRVVASVSGVSLVVGALLAIRQSGAKRLVGNLLVVESGYLLLGLLVLDERAVAAAFYTLGVDLFAVLGVFAVISHFRDQKGTDQLSSWRGALGGGVPETAALVLFLLCLIGIPPMPGFVGKFALIGAAVQHGWNGLAALAIFSTGLCTVAVSRLAYQLVGEFLMLPDREPETPTDPLQERNLRRGLLLGLMAPLVLVTIFSQALLGIVGKTLQLILW